MMTMSMFKFADPYQENRLEEYFLLRWRLLRKPWGQPKGTERDDQEENSLQRMLLDEDGKIVSCGRLHLNSPTEAQIRYMAVETGYRGKGIGKMMIEELENLAVNAGVKTIVLQARENAVEFYLACGYIKVKETFLLYDSIQHYLMIKNV
jgi:N-acetylglutamate synthase-like GNAT family acetyltransferase